jgi:hypothetical protein
MTPEEMVELLCEYDDGMKVTKAMTTEEEMYGFKYVLSYNYERWSWTESEIMGYAATFGAESAYNLLLLLPPDRFNGDYFKALEELKKRSDS